MKRDNDLGNIIQGPYLPDKDLDKQQNCSPQAMAFDPWCKDTIADLEKKSRLIRKYQQADPAVYGYPVVGIDAILYHYHWLIQRLLDESGLDPDEQEEHILSHIRRLAACVHLIQASGRHHHRTMGGLFEHSIECAIFAVKEIKKSKIFLGTSVYDATVPASRWIVAAILCALFHDIGKVKADAWIHNKDESIEYNPDTCTLLAWAGEKIGFSGTYFVSWRPNPKKHEEVLSLMLQSRYLIDSRTYDWLGMIAGREFRKFFDNCESALREPTINADRKSIDYCMWKGQYLRTPSRFFDLDRVNFLEAVKRLIFYGTQYREGRQAQWFVERGVRVRGWTIDSPDSALLSSRDGLYIVFDQLWQVRCAFELDNVQSCIFDIRKKTAELSSSELNGEVDRLVNYLKKAGCLSLCNGSPFWYVRRNNFYTGLKDTESIKTIRLTPLATGVIFYYKGQMITNSQLKRIEYKGEKNSDGSIKGFSTD